jgi:hypothetical protein
MLEKLFALRNAGLCHSTVKAMWFEVTARSPSTRVEIGKSGK